MRSFGAVALLCSAALLVSCSLLQQQEGKSESEQEEKVVIPPPLHLGAVHQVYPEQGFALLRMLGPVPIPGTTLITHPADGSNDRVGNLSVSNATGSRNGIIAADIRSGTVFKGDRVFLYREIAPPEPQEQDDDVPADADAAGDDTLITEDNSPIHPDAALPTPEPEPQQVDTTVLPEDTTPAPAPSVNTPDGIPDSIRDIPDSINDWDNM